MLDIFLYYVRFGGAIFIIVPLWFIAAYAVVKFGEMAILLFVRKNYAAVSENAKVLRALGIVFIATLIYLAASGYVVSKIASSVDPSAINSSDAFFMRMDERVFGFYPPFWLQSDTNPWRHIFDAFAPLIVKVYETLLGVIGVVFTLLLVLDAKRFTQMAFAFAFATTLAMPFWYFLPTLSPLEGYIDNVTHAELPPDARKLIAEYRPTAAAEAHFSSVRDVRRQLPPEIFAITTFPSMHVAWALVSVVFGILAWRPLAVLIVPYFVLNTVSVVYTMQHYAVDILAGIAVSAVAIACALALVKKPTGSVELATRSMQQDLTRARAVLQRAFID